MTVLSRFEAVRNYWMPRDTSVYVEVAVKDIDWVLHEIQRLQNANTKLVGALDQIHSVLNGEGDPQDLHLLVNEAIRAALAQQAEPVLTEVDPITGITFKATLKFDPEPMASTAVIQAAWKMGFDAAKAEQAEEVISKKLIFVGLNPEETTKAIELAKQLINLKAEKKNI
jgi:hypothetical protein